MKNEPHLDIFDTKAKAQHQAVWLNFKYRITKKRFSVIEAPKRQWAVVDEAMSEELGIPFIYDLSLDYRAMNYDDIRHIRMDTEPLPHWEELMGIFSVVHGELLRFILHSNIPIEKLIRYELAIRGYDKNHHWCGFEKSAEIWLE